MHRKHASRAGWSLVRLRAGSRRHSTVCSRRRAGAASASSSASSSAGAGAASRRRRRGLRLPGLRPRVRLVRKGVPPAGVALGAERHRPRRRAAAPRRPPALAHVGAQHRAQRPVLGKARRRLARRRRRRCRRRPPRRRRRRRRACAWTPFAPSANIRSRPEAGAGPSRCTRHDSGSAQ